MSPAILRTFKKVFSVILITAFLLPNVTPVFAASTPAQISGSVTHGGIGLSGVKLTYDLSGTTSVNGTDDTYAMFGTVTDPDGNPVDQSSIIFYDDAAGAYHLIAQTDSNGRFDFTGFAKTIENTHLVAGEISYDNTPLTLDGSGIARLYGAVTDGDGYPVPNAHVYFDDGSTSTIADVNGNFHFDIVAVGANAGDHITFGTGWVTTPANGSYMMANLPAGSYIVIPQRSGYIFQQPITTHSDLAGPVADDYTAVSTDATLSGLTANPGSLHETFVSGTHAYTADVAHTVTSITVTPEVNEPNATVTVNGVSAATPVALSVGANPITIVTTAQDGISHVTYTLTVTRATASSDATLSGLTINPGMLNETFVPATHSYTANVDNTVTSITVTPTVTEPNATVTVNGVSAATPVSLVVGPN
ncbi:MAG TPA: cadherin-like beta sandwich domain-containing protein, partial [Anaerolineaceae bacterium]